MPWKVDCLRLICPDGTHKGLGEIEVMDKPARNATVRFRLGDTVETGNISMLDPPDWEERDAVPKVEIRLSAGG